MYWYHIGLEILPLLEISRKIISNYPCCKINFKNIQDNTTPEYYLNFVESLFEKRPRYWTVFVENALNIHPARDIIKKLKSKFDNCLETNKYLAVKNIPRIYFPDVLSPNVEIHIDFIVDRPTDPHMCNVCKIDREVKFLVRYDINTPHC